MTDVDDRAGLLVLGRFRLQRRIGGGAMGDVYVASHEGLGRLVAVKILRSSARAASRARFRREATIAARLTGAHVVRVTDFGELPDGAPFLVMDFVDGPTLAAELDARGPLPVIEAVGRCLEVCEALAEAHRAGIVHRDIKPANLLLARSPDGSRVLRVADFGVAKAEGESTLTGDGASLGSPSYMSPEQIVDPHGVDARADVWAVGVVLFELLAGQRPFDGPTVPATLMAVAQANARRVDALRTEVPAGLVDVVARCLQKDPAARFDSAASLADALAPFGPDGASVVAARIRRVGMASLSGETVTLDPDAPMPVLGSPPVHANATTVTGGLTASPPQPSSPALGDAPRSRLRHLGGPLAMTVLVAAAIVALRQPAAPPPAVPPHTPTAGLSVSRQGEHPPPVGATVTSSEPALPPAVASSTRPPPPATGSIARAAGARGQRSTDKAVPVPVSTSAPVVAATMAPAAQTVAPPKALTPVLTTEVDDLGPRK